MGNFAIGSCEDVLAVLGVGLMFLVVEEIAGFSFVALGGGMVLRDEGGFFGLIRVTGVLEFLGMGEGFIALGGFLLVSGW